MKGHKKKLGYEGYNPTSVCTIDTYDKLFTHNIVLIYLSYCTSYHLDSFVNIKARKTEEKLKEKYCDLSERFVYGKTGFKERSHSIISCCGAFACGTAHNTAKHYIIRCQNKLILN